MFLNSLLSIAPMVDWTYTYFRILMRLLAPRALLYTEMQTTASILNHTSHILGFFTLETPLALQIGGVDIAALVQCAKLAEQYGYVEINLNLGCPSDRVVSGKFGACLMAEPKHVAACIAAMKDAVNIPITAKTRIGIDSQDSYEYFIDFATQLVQAGCDKIIVHARKAWLTGLSPKQNRTIPPLKYDYVYKLKACFPNLPVIINGNIQTIDDIVKHLSIVDGVMLGRLAYKNPWAIAQIHHALYPDHALPTRQEVLAEYIKYICQLPVNSRAFSLVLKPLYTLAHGQAFACQWKYKLMEMQRHGSIAELSSLIDAYSLGG